MTWGAGRGPAGAAGAAGPAPSGTGPVEVVAGVLTDPARSYATVRGALDATRRSTYTTTGWTVEDGGGGGSLAVVSGVYRATIPAATALTYLAGGYTAPRLRRALTVDGHAVDVRVRIAAKGAGADANTCVTLALESDTGGARTRVVGLRAYLVAGSTSCSTLYDLTTGGSWADQNTLRVASDGTGWLRLVCRAGGWDVYLGTGSGTSEPTSWVWVGSYNWTSLTAPLSPMTHLAVAVHQEVGAAGEVTVDVGQVIETALAEV